MDSTVSVMLQDAMLRLLQGKAANHTARDRYYGHVHSVSLELVDRFRTLGMDNIYVEDIEDELYDIADMIHDGDMPFERGIFLLNIRLRNTRYMTTTKG